MGNKRFKALLTAIMIAAVAISTLGSIGTANAAAATAVLTVTRIQTVNPTTLTVGDQDQELVRFQLAANGAEDVQVTRLTLSVSTTPQTPAGAVGNYRLMVNGVLLTTQAVLAPANGTVRLLTFSDFRLVVPRDGKLPVSLVADVFGPSATNSQLQFGMVKPATGALPVVAQGVSTGNTLGRNAIVLSPTNNLWSGRMTLVNPIIQNAQVVFSIDGTTPITSVVAVGATGSGVEFPMLAVDVDPNNDDIEITRIQFNHTLSTGDASDRDFADNGIKLYRRVNGGAEVLIGSTTFVSSTLNAGYIAVFQNFSSPLVFDKDNVNTLIVKAVFNGTSTGVPAGSSPFIQLGNGAMADTSIVTIRSVSSNVTLGNGDINGASTLNISGYQKVLYRSYPTFTTVNLANNGSNNSLINGVENDIYRFSIHAASMGNVSMKQLRFRVDIGDVSSVVNNLSLGRFKLYRDGIEITNNITIVNTVTGVSLKAGGQSLQNGLDQSITITWPGTNEEVIPAGSTYTYTLKATTGGFFTDADNDFIRVRLENNQSTNGELSRYIRPYYLTYGSPLQNIVTLSDTESLNTTTADIIWSDRSAVGHSAAVSPYTTQVSPALSTGDWFNGYYLPTTPLNFSTLIY